MKVYILAASPLYHYFMSAGKLIARVLLVEVRLNVSLILLLN